MKTLKLFFVIALFILVACTHKSDVCKQLEKVDSLLCCNMVDSAVCIFNSIEPLTESDSAYYFVLKGEVDYRLRIVTDSLALNYSIRYYTKHTNNRELALAYYYKAMISVIAHSWTNKDFLFLKQAENYAEPTTDNKLKNKISTGLRYLNCVFGNFDEALVYANKELFYSQSLGNRDKAYAFLALSSVHKELGNRGSTEYYLLQCKRMSSDVDDEDKAFIYNMLGENFVAENKDAALSYFKTALNYKKLSASYKNIADIYFSLQDTANWRMYCDSALIKAGDDLKTNILSQMAIVYYDSRNLPNYKHSVDKLIAIYKQQIADLKENYTLQIQKKYDFQKQQSHYENIFLLQIALIFFVIAVGAVVTLFYKRKIYKLRQRRLIIESENSILHEKLRQTNHQMNDYISQIDYLNNQNAELSANGENMSVIISNNEAYIADLKSKLGVLNNETKQSLEVGRVIYDKMCNNESISDYKNRLADGLFYFEVTYPECHQILAQYNNLTVGNMLFVLCDDFLHKDDEQIGSVFEISVSTVRSRRTKLKGKMS